MTLHLRTFQTLKMLIQSELAQHAGVTVVTISRLENGHGQPQFTTIRTLAKALGVEPEQVVDSQTRIERS